MKELVIISGKGGSGKTCLTGALASLAPNSVLIDADVDAADLHLLFDCHTIKDTIFKGGFKAHINQQLCLFCGECMTRCQFKAVTDDFTIDPIRCEGCGVCRYFCPAGAIDFQRQISGKWFISEIKTGVLVHARLGIGEENSGMLIALLRQEAKKLAEQRGSDMIIVDGPPGIGCPVISSITGADAVLLIAEPSSSGWHDLKRVHQLTQSLSVPSMLVINKYDINTDITGKMMEYADRHHIKFLGTIPYDTSIISAMVEGKNVLEKSESPAAKSIKEIWRLAKDHLQILLPSFYFPGYQPATAKSLDTVR